MLYKTSKLCNLMIAVLFTISNVVLLPDIAVAVDYSCNDVTFVFARGSGEQLGDTSATAWQTEIHNQLIGTGLKYDFYELGTMSQGGYQYPAAAVSGNLGSYITMLGAYVSGGSAFEFGRSVRQGVEELKAYLAQATESCPNTKFVLGGYSQGAMVISGTLNELDADKILYVATFGDPKIYLPEGNNRILEVIPKIPDACLGKNLSPYRIDVPDCRAYEGVLGSYRPYQPATYAGKVGTWCNESDIMCSSGMSTNDHVLYVAKQLYVDAARKIATIVRQELADRISIGDDLAKHMHDIAFVVDSTISMRDALDDYRAEAKKLAAAAVASGGRVALFEYRDVSIFPTRELCTFDCTLDEFNAQIDGIVANGGAEADESALSAIMTALDTADWRPEAKNSIILLTDAGYHDPDYDDATLEMVVERSRGVVSHVSRSNANPSPVAIHVITKTREFSAYSELARQVDGGVFTYEAPSDYIMQAVFGQPVAKLLLEQYSGSIGDELIFNASESYAQNDSNLRFDWDLDGDNVFELEDAGPIVQKTFSSAFNGSIQVRVIDSNNNTDVATTQVAINAIALEPELPSSISNIQVSPLVNDSLEISFTTDADSVLLSVNGEILGYLTLNAGFARFTLGELSDAATIVLTPYLHRVRGILSTINLAADGGITIDVSDYGTSDNDSSDNGSSNDGSSNNDTDMPGSSGGTNNGSSDIPAGIITGLGGASVGTPMPDATSPTTSTTSSPSKPKLPTAPNTGHRN